MYYKIPKKIENLLDSLSIDYLAIVECKNKDIRNIKYLSNNIEWCENYYEKKLITQCPLVKSGIGVQSQSLILPWNSVPTFTKKEKTITEMRKKDFNIHQGISFLFKNGNDTLSYALGTSYNNIDFYKELCENEDKIRHIILEMGYEFRGTNK